MTASGRRVVLGLLAAVVTACASHRSGPTGPSAVAAGMSVSAAGQEVTVRGTAAYRERVALAPDVVFEATLENVSRADAKADVLGTVRVEPAGQVPIAFEISYNSATIDERFTYAVRGRILSADGQLMFTTDTLHPVITRGRGNTVELRLVRVQSSGLAR